MHFYLIDVDLSLLEVGNCNLQAFKLRERLRGSHLFFTPRGADEHVVADVSLVVQHTIGMCQALICCQIKLGRMPSLITRAGLRAASPVRAGISLKQYCLTCQKSETTFVMYAWRIYSRLMRLVTQNVLFTLRAVAYLCNMSN